MPIARECGVDEAVTEMPGRLDYLDALGVLVDSSAILLLGSSERHYTASKLFPALLAKRPILALFNEASSVVSILRAAASEPTIRIVTYGDGEASDELVGEAACHLRALASSAAYIDGDVSLKGIADVSARHLAHQLAGIFDKVAA
jgi:hypothetical protein